MRLRPFGASGPLVVSVASFESYLVQHGRDWERYAYVKARLVTGREFERDVFDLVLTPFVYRRYLDYGVFDALRQMKTLIAKEVARKDMAENIKLGPGGIREIEFITQAFQLVRGGRRAELRTRSLLQALPLLAGDRQFAGHASTSSPPIRFLRPLENRLQALDDRQTHELPERRRGACASRLCARRAELGRPVTRGSNAQRAHRRDAVRARRVGRRRPRTAARRGTRWRRVGGRYALRAVLAARRSRTTPQVTATVTRAAWRQSLSAHGRGRRANDSRPSIGRTIALIATHDAPAKALERVLPIYRAVGRRSAYLSLLNENPAALERLLNLVCAERVAREADRRAADAARRAARRAAVRHPPTREELEDLLERTLRGVPPDDDEGLLEAIRIFQRTAIFRIAIADRLGSLPLMKVSDRLTDTAELVLGHALGMAWRELVAKHGTPFSGPPPREVGFAVIGYGKLGGLELGYGSDLDLVFLNDSRGAQQETTASRRSTTSGSSRRLVQRLVHFLTIQTSSGRLYDVDTRLRPSGRAGLLVSGMDGFYRYQKEDAWVWEHQALLRSRALVGSRSVCDEFERLRREVLVAHVHRDKLKVDVARMRRRMRDELSLAKRGGFDLKQDRGGLADIEFLIDYWVLASSREYPELVEFPDNVRQLEALERVGLVPAERCRRMKEAYLALRRRIHELALDEGGRVVPDAEFEELRAWVAGVWDEVFAGVDDTGELVETAEAAAARPTGPV